MSPARCVCGGVIVTRNRVTPQGYTWGGRCALCGMEFGNIPPEAGAEPAPEAERAQPHRHTHGGIL